MGRDTKEEGFKRGERWFKRSATRWKHYIKSNIASPVSLPLLCLYFSWVRDVGGLWSLSGAGLRLRMKNSLQDGRMKAARATDGQAGMTKAKLSCGSDYHIPAGTHAFPI